jgi:hypothetical protein
MAITQPDVQVGPSATCKFRLKFLPVSVETTKEFVLTIERDGKILERIKIIANYC